MAQQGNKVAILKLAGIVVGVVVYFTGFWGSSGDEGYLQLRAERSGRRGLVLLEVGEQLRRVGSGYYSYVYEAD
jgi:hypothetical protein